MIKFSYKMISFILMLALSVFISTNLFSHEKISKYSKSNINSNEFENLEINNYTFENPTFDKSMKFVDGKLNLNEYNKFEVKYENKNFILPDYKYYTMLSPIGDITHYKSRCI